MMRLSISNIAWETEEDVSIAHVLREESVNAIDIAPGKYFPDPAKTSDSALRHVRDMWKERGVEIVGMQALLFGTQGLNLFGDEATQDRMLDHLEAVCRIGDGVGARRLVFGSPKNRDRGQLKDAEVQTRAIDFFRRAGERAQRWNVILCLEPNPAVYGCNFMTHTLEAADLVRQIQHSAIRLQLDTGTLALNGEAPEATVLAVRDCVGHIHASDPHLATLGGCEDHHRVCAQALAKHLPGSLVTIEMVASKTEPHAQAIRRAVRFAKSLYGHAAA